jgi:hypothetical protein
MGRNTLTKTVLAYTAGLFDGEGCIRYRDTEIVHITSCYPHHLRRISGYFDMGKVRKIVNTRPNTRTAWRLDLSGKDARAFIIAIRPYLFEKAYQADIMLSIKDMPKNSLTRTRAIEELAKAKRIEYGPS